MSESAETDHTQAPGEAENRGIDLPLLLYNPKRTPQERAESVAAAAKFILETRELNRQSARLRPQTPFIDLSDRRTI